MNKQRKRVLLAERDEPYEVKLLKWMATQLTEDYMPDLLATLIHEHYDELVTCKVTRFAIPVDRTMSDFIRHHWPRGNRPVPSDAVVTALAIVICGVVEGMAREESEGQATN